MRRGRRGATPHPGARLRSRPGLPLLTLGTLALSATLAGCIGIPGTAGRADPPAPVTTSPSSTTTAPTGTPTVSPMPNPAASPHLAVVPLAGAGPKVRFPSAPPAVGSGAHATEAAIPSSEWARMVGYSWTPGCPVGRSALRMIEVNYWGFDGTRHRGTLVVASTITTRTMQAFTALYAQHFRIRLIRPMDSTWGHDPKGPGADDYAAMRADNTSAFNCRYVGGEEASKVWSNHAYGRAIDVNDFENPYVDTGGTVYPNAYFLHRRTGAGTFTSATSPAVRAFTRLGFRWGGLWSPPDLQHMEIS